MLKVDWSWSEGGKLTKIYKLIDFKANNLREWPADPLSVSTWTWKLLNGYQMSVYYTFSSLYLSKSWLALIIMGKITKITMPINFCQKYTKDELNDPMVIWKLMKLSIIDFILCLSWCLAFKVDWSWSQGCKLTKIYK